MRAPGGEMLPSARRRWSKKTQVLAVLGLSLAVVVLTVGMVGFARSIDFVTRVGVASKLLDDAGQISPDVTVVAGPSATPAAQNPSAPPAPAEPSAPEPAAPSRVAAGGNVSALAVTDSAGNAAIAGAGGSVSGAGGAAGMAGSGGAVGTGGAAGATPGSWEDQLQRMAVSLAQTSSTMCGPNTCNVGLVCCNWSCGVCAPPGATCDQTPCPGSARAPTAVRCGSAQCNDGLVCCNPSCGICAAPGQTCSTETCP
jgi:hypothetical protein